MTVVAAIADAERLLPGTAAPDGEVDIRWQVIIAVGDFVASHPEDVWRFVARWGVSEDEDLRDAIATCVLEHLLQQHYDRVIGRVEGLAAKDSCFADTVSRCWPLGLAEEPSRRARLRSAGRRRRDTSA
jgi:hypothetical protein